MKDKKPINHKELVASLPGSSRGDNNHVGITNYVLMPQTSKLPGLNPSQTRSSSPPPPHLLGSGSKIPESQHARMCSQFSSPDPARFLPKKKVAPIKRPEEGSWIEHGRPAVSCSVYKSVPSTKAKEAEAQGDPKKIAAAAAKEKYRVEQQRKQLMGLKERVLSNLCTNPNLVAGSSPVQSAICIITNINRQLGLPSYDTGSWRLPT